MRKRVWKHVLAITCASVMLAAPLPSEAGQLGRGRTNTPGIYQDRAGANGYGTGYDRGLVDGRGGQRYDPVRHRDYRDAERGYTESYGSRDGYKTNFRAGFRQGYEEGYREGVRSRK